jgi:hypothetical protein
MQIRDRIKELRRVPANQLRPNAKNWRVHPSAQQDALRGVLAEIGYAGALLARETDDGSLELIDGHLRAETTPDCLVPVLVLDITSAEADKLLATYDPLSAMADINSGTLEKLLAETNIESPAVRAMMDQILAEAKSLSGQKFPTDTSPEVKLPALFQIVVECQSEQQQEELFAQLNAQGYKCRVLTL